MDTSKMVGLAITLPFAQSCTAVATKMVDDISKRPDDDPIKQCCSIIAFSAGVGFIGHLPDAIVSR